MLCIVFTAKLLDFYKNYLVPVMNELYRALRPMSVGDILNRAVALYRDNFAKFIGVILPGKFFIVIITLVVSTILTADDSTLGALPNNKAFQHAGNFPIIILTYFIESIVIAAGAIIISERFLDRDISIANSYRNVLVQLFPLIGAVVASTIVISIGLFLCAIPGLIFMVWYSLISQVVMIEGEGGLGAMKRSKYLVAGYFLKVFGIIILVWIAEMLFLNIVSVLASTATRMVTLKIVGSFLSVLAFILIEPFKIAAITMLYYDLRIRKEGFDLEIMAEELAQYNVELSKQDYSDRF